MIEDRAEGPGLASRLGRGLARWSLVIGLFVLWDALSRSGAFTPFMLPSPESVLERVWRDQGFTAILVTHDVAEAVALADRVLIIEEGRIAHDLDELLGIGLLDG